MKKLGFILLIIILGSCSERQKETSAAASGNENETKLPQDKANFDGQVPVMDFEQLESALLNRKNDTTYVVNFWATWCKPCIKELPYFEELGRTYAEQKVKVVLVSLDFPENLQTKVIPFIEKHRLASEVILLDDTDANTWIPKVSEKWEGSIPATLFFKADAKIFKEQSFTYEELENEVKSIL